MSIYIIYKVYQNRDKTCTPGGVKLIGAYTDQFVAYKYACAKQIEEFLCFGERDVVEELPEFPDAYGTLEDYIEYFKTITSKQVLENVINSDGLDVYKVQELEINTGAEPL